MWGSPLLAGEKYMLGKNHIYPQSSYHTAAHSVAPLDSPSPRVALREQIHYRIY